MEVKIRKATADDAKGIARVHVDAWKSTYRGLVSDEYLDSLSYESREQMWAKVIDSNKQTSEDFIIVACDGNEIVGFAAGGRSRDSADKFEGEIGAIYILEHYQRMGIGRRLMSAAVEHLFDAGIASMIIWVLRENNNAIRFYESLGGKLVGTKEMKIGDRFHTIVGYGWDVLEYQFKEWNKR